MSWKGTLKSRANGRMVFGALAALLASVAAGPAESQDRYAEIRKELVEPGVLIVADPGTSPPNCFIDEKGNAQGYFVDLTRRYAERIGVKYRFVPLDWPGVLPGLTSLRFDMGGCQVTQTAERLASEAFIASTYLSGQGIRMVVPDRSPIRDWDDAKDKTLGAEKGSAELRAVREKLPSARYKEYGGFGEIILDLGNRRIDAGIGPELVMAGLIQKNPNFKLKLVGTPINYTSRGTFFAPTHRRMAADFNAFVEELRSNGQLDAMIEKWYGHSFDWKRIEGVYQSTMAEAEKLRARK